MPNLNHFTVRNAAGMILLAGLGLAAAPARYPTNESTISLIGTLQVSDDRMDDVVVIMKMDGTKQLVSVSKTGRFTMDMPSDKKATLLFDKPGYLSKEVVVDTHHADKGWSDQENRLVKFGVVLYPENALIPVRHLGPVATIGFDPANGKLTATQDLSIVPVRRQTIREF